MSSQSHAPQDQSAVSLDTDATTTSAPSTATAGPANSDLAADLGLGGVLGPITDMLGDVWDWLWGNDEDQQSTDQQSPDQDGPTCTPPIDATPPALTDVEGVNAADVRATYANNPRAQAALDALTGDANFSSLTPAQQGGIIQRFQEAPNAATTQYLQGLAAYHTSDDPCGTGQATYEDALRADSGTFTSNGTAYTIRDGQLINAEGNVAGDVRTDGTYRMTGATDWSNYYDDHHTAISMTEGTGADQQDLLTLHDADPNSALQDDNVNDTFSGMATQTLRDVRREGMDMRVGNTYRSIAQQDRLYAQGRTAPGGRVTNAPGGSSWHNYGVASDIVFNDANGNQSWPETGDYRQLWTRYGELAEGNGLEWGGRWNNPDRPHVEYHPGYTASNASTLRNTTNRGGLEAAWDQMGIGEQP